MSDGLGGISMCVQRVAQQIEHEREVGMERGRGAGARRCDAACAPEIRPSQGQQDSSRYTCPPPAMIIRR